MWSPAQVIEAFGAATTLLGAATAFVNASNKFVTSRFSEMAELVIEKTPAF
jgi:hypothetical protein